MIDRLTKNLLELTPAARARLVAIKNLDRNIANQESTIRTLKRQLSDREAELFSEAGAPGKDGKAPSVEARKNLTHLAKKDDAAYLDTLGLLEDAQRELDGMKADLDEMLREHALDKRELDALASALRAHAGTKDVAETDPIARSAPATAAASNLDIF